MVKTYTTALLRRKSFLGKQNASGNASEKGSVLLSSETLG